MSDTANIAYGDKYVFFSITVPGSTTNFNVCEEYSGKFPDWDADWSEREVWTDLVIKDLIANITFKFHHDFEDSITVITDDMPFIFGDFHFRDIYITNLNLDPVTMNLMFMNRHQVAAPPKRPSNLVLEVINATTVKLTFKDNSRTESFFKVERSDVSDVAGFVQVGIVRNIMEGYRDTITYTDSTCLGGTQYWYRVRAYSQEGGNSGYSSVETATTP